MTPSYIGRYRIESVLSEGAFGLVYKAYDELIGRWVAIKCLRPENWTVEKEREQRVQDFFNEAKIIGTLHHSHITTIYDMGIQDRVPFIVMEFVEGNTLKQILEKDLGFQTKDVLKVIANIARTLHYIHQRGFLHRDIKPGNIMIEPNLSPKIMDFGVAVVANKASSEHKQFTQQSTNRIAGTPSYMSPEQVRGEKVDERSDLFSLGVLTYEWLANRRPYQGETTVEVTRSILEEEPILLSKLCKCDRQLEDIIHRALRKKPGERFRNLEEFSDELEVYCSRHFKTEKVEEPGSAAQMRTIGKLRKRYVFFADFEERELLEIFRISQRARFNKNDVIIWQGTSGVEMYFILKGSVIVRENLNDRDLDIQTLGEGDCFGEMAIVDRHPRSASVIAREETTVVVMNEAVLRKSRPELCMKLYRSLAAVISEKLRDTDRRHLDLVAKLSKLLANIQSDAGGRADLATIDMDSLSQDMDTKPC